MRLDACNAKLDKIVKSTKKNIQSINLDLSIPDDFIQFNGLIGLPLHPVTNQPTPLMPYQLEFIKTIPQDRNGRFLLADAAGETPELGGQIGVSSVGRGPGALVEGLSEPPVAFVGLPKQKLADHEIAFHLLCVDLAFDKFRGLAGRVLGGFVDLLPVSLAGGGSQNNTAA